VALGKYYYQMAKPFSFKKQYRDDHSNLTILSFLIFSVSCRLCLLQSLADKGKAIADAYRTPTDDYVDRNAAALDPRLKELEDILL
jgi:hypothetical protein